MTQCDTRDPVMLIAKQKQDPADAYGSALLCTSNPLRFAQDDAQTELLVFYY